MKNWVVVLLIFTLPLSLYAYFDAKANNEASNKVTNNKEAMHASKAKVIKFSSPMCSECKEMAIEMEKALKEYKGNVVIEEINVVENVGKGIKYNKSQIKKYNVNLVPTLVFVDQEGEIYKKQEGLMKKNEIIEVLEEIED